MTHQPMSLNVGNYVLERQIGRGATARVWLGRHRSLTHRQFAIKMSQTLLDHETQMLQREALMMSRLAHPAIPRIYDHGIMPTFHYIVMDFAPGVSLRHLLKVHRTLPIEHVLPIAQQIAAVIDYIHMHGIIHRDINPNNILIDGSDNTTQIALIDFGIALDTQQPSSPSPVNELGTKPYMSPEQRADANDVLHLSDIFSFGVILFEMLAGNLPWDDQPTHTVPTLTQRGGSGIPSEVDDVLSTLMAYDATARYRTATEAVTDLQRIYAKHTAQTTIVVEQEPVVISQSAHPVEVALAVALKQEIINESLAFAQQTGTPEIIRELMNAWGDAHFYRRKLLGRRANITSIQNRTIFHYTVNWVSESRYQPHTVTTISPLADEPISETVTTSDRWQLTLPTLQPSQPDMRGLLVVPGSQTRIPCPHCNEGKRICPTCHNRPITGSDGTQTAACTVCRGTGHVSCHECLGNGQLYQHLEMKWQRHGHSHTTHDDHAHVPQSWLNSHCTPRLVYKHQEGNGIRPEWKRIPKVAQLIDEISNRLPQDSRIVVCELSIYVVPMSEFIFDIGHEYPWIQAGTPPQYRWQVYGFERILTPNRQLIDWQLIALIVVSGWCAILTIGVILLVT
ncbi:MAG: hypothetical protein RL076_2484 [Chloroflexota bacterium]